MLHFFVVEIKEIRFLKELTLRVQKIMKIIVLEGLKLGLNIVMASSNLACPWRITANYINNARFVYILSVC